MQKNRNCKIANKIYKDDGSYRNCSYTVLTFDHYYYYYFLKFHCCEKKSEIKITRIKNYPGITQLFEDWQKKELIIKTVPTSIIGIAMYKTLFN